MELSELINIIRRWAWLLAISLLAGLLVGFLVSIFMDPVYEVSTQLMISRAIQDENPDFAGLNSQQLVQTHIQILKTKSLLDTTIHKAGVEVDSEQVTVQQIDDTQILEIKVKDHNPDIAVNIANTMVQVLIEWNESMQTSQYLTLESRLTKQVEQVQAQIDALQEEYDQAYEMDYQDQLSKINEQITEIQAELSTLHTEIFALYPVYSQADQALLAEKQVRVDQLQSMFVTYEEIRANLLIMGKPLQSNNIVVASRLQQLQPTLDLYQNLHLTLVEDLEKVRLARLQQTPNVVQIEAATIPEKPVRPIPTLYSLLSGMVGLMLASGWIFFIEVRRRDKTIPVDVAQLEEIEQPVVVGKPDEVEQPEEVEQAVPKKKVKKK